MFALFYTFVSICRNVFTVAYRFMSYLIRPHNCDFTLKLVLNTLQVFRDFVHFNTVLETLRLQ